MSGRRDDDAGLLLSPPIKLVTSILWADDGRQGPLAVPVQLGPEGRANLGSLASVAFVSAVRTWWSRTRRDTNKR
jgi:hypothetical protein